MTTVYSSIATVYTIQSYHSTDPYRRLFAEMVEHLENQTAPGGEFEGFFIYINQPKNKTLHFPCIVLDMNLGGSEKMFSDDYGESGVITFKIMFTKKHVLFLNKL